MLYIVNLRRAYTFKMYFIFMYIFVKEALVGQKWRPNHRIDQLPADILTNIS